MHLLQPLLVVFLGKSHVPQKFGINPFERLISMGSGLLDAISVPLTGLIVRGVVLGLGHGGTEPTADSAAGGGGT